MCAKGCVSILFFIYFYCIRVVTIRVKGWSIIVGVVLLLGWFISNHKELRSFYDTYQSSLHLPKLPPVIKDSKEQHKDKKK